MVVVDVMANGLFFSFLFFSCLAFWSCWLSISDVVSLKSLEF